jgi:hypothetical protein
MSEALRLAELIDNDLKKAAHHEEAAAELRRLHAVNDSDTALLRQALDCLENHVMQRTYAGGVVICNTAIALRERLALSDAALLAPKPGQLKDRGKK